MQPVYVCGRVSFAHIWIQWTGEAGKLPQVRKRVNATIIHQIHHLLKLIPEWVEG